MIEDIHEKFYRFINIPSGDLRISVTNCCNMKCVYCHNEGQKCSRRFLSVDNIAYIVEKSLKYGVSKVRLTGGEPLLHRDIVSICKVLHNKFGIKNLGINTNAYDKDTLFELCELNVLNQIVIGIDYYDSTISKASPIGLSSSEVLNIVQILRNRNTNVQISMVYLDDIEEIYDMVKWCFKNKVLLKILEQTGSANYTLPYCDMLEKVIKHFNLFVGLTVDLNELYAFDADGNKILFFQSHCNRRECDNCKTMHMRVTSEGFAKPCLLREDTSFSLLENFDMSMKKAIANLGNPPENPVR